MPIDPMKFLFRIVVFCLLPAAAAGCTVNPATGKQSFTAFMSQADEMRVGQEEHPKIIKAFGGAYNDEKLSAYVRRVGLSLVAVSEVQGLPYTFTVLNDEKVNAFALPDGYVYITRGLLALAENEAEMAGVLAHEIGHITARHTAQRFSNAQAANIGMTVISILGGANAPGASDLLSKVAQIALQGYSREQEMEADMLGARYLIRAGYSPAAMPDFLRKLQAYTELTASLSGNPELAADAGDIMSTHPRTADRLAQAIGLAGAAPQNNYRLESRVFLEHIDGLMFGDDPNQGVRKGREFSHPDLGVSFKVPPGFVMFNSADKILARGRDGATIVFDMEGARTAGSVRDLLAYLQDNWGEGLSLREAERINVNGMEAATGQGRISMRNGSLKDIRLLAIRENRDRIYRFLFLTPPAFTDRYATEFQRATYSFRRLSPSELAAIRPLRLRVVTVGRQDTAAGLAARMPFEQGGLEWFEVLNGLNRGQPLIPGETVKIVAE